MLLSFSETFFRVQGRTSTPEYMLSSTTNEIGSGNGLNMYLSPGTWVRFPRKAKTPIEKGVGEDCEVAVGTTYIGGVKRDGAE